MSGEELDKKLTEAGYVKAEIARLLGVPPQSVNQSLNAQDVKSGFLEDLCRVLNVDMSFFYSFDTNEEVTKLQEENARLKAEVVRLSDPNHSDKENRVYNLWMKFMEVTAEMKELYKEIGE